MTAVGKGTATITVTTEDGSYTATCTVTVKLPVSGVTLNETATSMVVDDTRQLTATVEPAGADDSTVTWTSGDAKIATVDQNGKVTAVGIGTTTIIATAGGKCATCTVTVTAKPVPIKGIALSDAAVSVGRSIQLERSSHPRTPRSATLSGRALTGPSRRSMQTVVSAALPRAR